MALEATHVDVERMRPDGRPALRIEGLNLSLDRKSITALVGRSASGKSTILNLLAGFLSAKSGKVMCDGVVVRQPTSPVVLAYQDYARAVFPWMSVYGNLAIGLRKNPVSRSEGRDRVMAAAKTLGITAELDVKAGRLSGGQRQRVQLGRALVSRPHYMLLDEPDSSLDIYWQRELRRELGVFRNDYDVGILIATHHLPEAVFIADRVLSLRSIDGKATLHEVPGYGWKLPSLEDAMADKEFQQRYAAVKAEVASA